MTALTELRSYRASRKRFVSGFLHGSRLVRDPLGRPLLFAFASRCRYTVNGHAVQRPTTSGYFLAIVKSPDGAGCLSRWPVVGALKPDLLPVCNFYFLSGAWDNPTVVRTYREFAPGIAIRYVRDLAFETGGLDLTRLGAPLRFRAGPPTPSPFELDAVLREQPVAGPATFSFYTDSSGTSGARLEIDGLALGQMDVRLRVDPESEMAALLGTETPDSDRGLRWALPTRGGEAPLWPRRDAHDAGLRGPTDHDRRRGANKRHARPCQTLRAGARDLGVKFMTATRALHLSLELHSAGERIAGRLRDRQGNDWPLSSWVGLLTLIERLRASASSSLTNESSQPEVS